MKLDEEPAGFPAGLSLVLSWFSSAFCCGKAPTGATHSRGSFGWGGGASQRHLTAVKMADGKLQLPHARGTTSAEASQALGTKEGMDGGCLIVTATTSNLASCSSILLRVEEQREDPRGLSLPGGL